MHERAQSYINCLECLAGRTELIRNAAEAGDWETVLAGLDERQLLMNQIDAFPSGARLLSNEESTLAVRLLERIADQDGYVTRMLQAAAESTRVELEKSRLAEATLSAYSKKASTPPQSRFVDTQR